MHRVIQYTIFFAVVVLLQVFLFNNLNLSIFINPLVYVGFIVLLPMETRPLAMVVLGFVTGMSFDLLTGAAGLNTAATLVTTYSRRGVLMLMIGKETVSEGGIPCARVLGGRRFLRYAAMVVLVQCIVIFTLETLNFRYFHYTLLKIALSTAVTTMLIYFVQMLLPGSYAKRSF